MPRSVRLPCLTVLLTTLVLPGTALARQVAPPLSDTIRAVMDRDGVEAARHRFAAIYPDHVADYTVDLKAMANLGTEYMKAGDMARGQAVMQMVSTLAGASIAENLPAAMAAEPDRARARRSTEERPRRQPSRAPAPNPLTDEIARRYEGVFADPNETDANRRYFLARDPCAPDVMFGAMWGDAENTYLKIESEAVLAQPPEQARYGDPLRIEIEFGADGHADRLWVDSEWAPGTLIRRGELPERWKSSPCTRG